MIIDSVPRAASDPEKPQPYAELGLKSDEYERIRRILGRRPTSSELAMYSVMWSEHCSYKSSKVHLKQFSEKKVDSDCLLVGIGQNAGVVDVGGDYAVTFKVESHNHPSFVEPYQGAATGVGGIVRDILTMGARPIAVMDSLKFGPIEHPDTKRVLTGVVSGISGYGNCLGLPNIGGETTFDESYLGNPLVNALAVGVMRHSDIKLATATGTGNLVVLFGAKTGGDGIGGVSVLASETFTEGKSSKRPSVQVGDPFTEKVLIECSLEIFAADLVVGIQDLGGAGLSCATSELASGGSGGMEIYLHKVPLRDNTLSPEEILMSESQERMCAIIEPDAEPQFMEICKKWDVSATVIGKVIDGDRLKIYWHDELIVDVPPRSVAHEGPVYNRAIREPAGWELQKKASIEPPIPQSHEALQSALIRLLSSANICDKNWITEKYDRYVRGNTVLASPDDAGVIRLGDETYRGIALSCDSNARWSKLNPYHGAQLALVESAINVATVGATPLAISNCLNFGSPEVPEIMWQFSETVRGLADAAVSLQLPVTGGNVSFYNQTKDEAILPTPVIAVLGVVDDVRHLTPRKISKPDLDLALIGPRSTNFAGSQWAYLNGLSGGDAPQVDLTSVRRIVEFILRERSGFIAAHDVSDGGIAVSLFEMTRNSEVGCQIEIPISELFAESPSRIIVACENFDDVAERASSDGVEIMKLGRSGGGALTINGDRIEYSLLNAAFTGVLERNFGKEVFDGATR